MRNILAIAIVLALTVASADATLIWISPSGTSSAPPANVDATPVLPSTGSLYVWARPDANKTLQNWSLNIHTTTPDVINFTAVDVLNPVLGVQSFPPPPKNIQRYEFIGEPAPQAGGEAINTFQGFSVANTAAIGVGIGPGTTGPPFADPFYDAANNSWLLAKVDYVANGGGSTDLYLQIGMNGLANAGESTSQNSAVFGAMTDPGLNGDTQRGLDSATRDARIGEGPPPPECLPPRFLNRDGICVPEPSCFVLAALSVLGLVWFGRNRIPA